MGGFGSGMWFRDDAKQTTRRVLELDVRKVRRRGLIAPGQEELDIPEGGLTIPLTWTPMPQGGARPWFLCPDEDGGCGRRVAILYLENQRRVLLCRLCLDLVYESQRVNQVRRAKMRADKARAKLGPDEAPRPKGMHHETFVRLGCEYVKARREHVALWRARNAQMAESREKAHVRNIEEMEAEKRWMEAEDRKLGL